MSLVATTKPKTQPAQQVVRTSFWILLGARCQHELVTVVTVLQGMHHQQCKTLLPSTQSTVVGDLLGMVQAADHNLFLDMKEPRPSAQWACAENGRGSIRHAHSKG
jgi:hypothetical protein